MISLQDLHFQYQGTTKPALRSLSFEVQPGHIFGLLGPSGSGKSTTQKLLTGLLRGYTGSLSILGATPGGSAFYERIGVGFELPNLYARLTARENLAFFGSLYKRPPLDIDTLLDRVALGDHKDTRAQDMSKGMRMRVNFCRAILHQPDVLLLDEPTSGLDPSIAALLRALIAEQRERGATILLSTHNMHEAAELCDQVGFLIDGTLAACDAPDALMRTHGRRDVRVDYLDDTHQLAHATFPMDGLGHDQAFQTLLQTRTVQAIHSREATLDDVFVKLTGRSLT
jgi:fluoroquinolone transport system ATP-binding protein